MTTRAALLRELAALRPRLADIRQQAILACAADPAMWLAVQGVPLASYLAQLDALEALCGLAGEEGAA